MVAVVVMAWWEAWHERESDLGQRVFVVVVVVLVVVAVGHGGGLIGGVM
jgi:hypothetical protein